MFRARCTDLVLSAFIAFREVTSKSVKSGRWTVFSRNSTSSIGKYRISYVNFGKPFIPFSFSNFEHIMGKKGGGFYAVARGRTVGTFMTWDECKAQVDGFPNARYKKFATSEEAQAFINEHMVKPGAAAQAPLKKVSSSTSQSKSATSSTGSKVTMGTSIPGAKRGLPIYQNPGAGSKPVNFVANSFKTGQKRDLSSLKVTEDRVVNKRVKVDPGPSNSHADLSSFVVDEEGYVVVFTDGACAKNGRKAAKAGIGVWFGHNHPLNISEPVTGRQTNNTAEIQAAERAIRQAKIHGINKLKVKTDSQFTINCVTKWLYNWRRNNWRLSSGGDVKNKEDLIKLDESMQNMEIKWSYVAGHAGIEGNEAADRLAVAGAERA